jgi:hypothetical protein
MSEIITPGMIGDWARRATEAESKNGDLQFALDHWIAVADTLKQQRDSAEKERDALRLSMTFLREFVLSDARAVSFQTMHQYRRALVAAIRDALESK